MSTFILQLVVTEAVGLAQAFIQVALSAKRPNLASALENLVAAGQATVLAISAGN